MAHGKSTVVKAISGVQTVRFKNELERNITIKLGYANAKIFCAKDGKVPRPQSYKAYGSSKEDNPPCDAPGYEGAEMELLRHVSFVDCPGHDILMATMLNGAAVMDGALLLIAANESCPQPQTSEHLAAVEIMQLKHIIILQNKIDLISESVAANQHEAISSFIQGTIAEGAPVVPISAQLKYNVDAVCEYIVKKIPVPVRSVMQHERHGHVRGARPCPFTGSKFCRRGSATTYDCNHAMQRYACSDKVMSEQRNLLASLCSISNRLI